MRIKTAALQGQKSLFLFSLLASLSLHGLVFTYLPNTQKSENIIKTESVAVVFMGSKKNTAPVRETGSDPTGFDLQRNIKSQSIEKKKLLSIDSFSKDIPKKSVSIKMKQDFNAILKNRIPQISKLEKNFNNRTLTVSSEEKIPLHARLYLNSWEKKIEKIGNLNYPKKATKNNVYGSLELLVSILPNGELNEIRLIESSGHLVLDKAAISIVKMASPFAPFPEEMLQSVDLLEVIRIWDFRKNASQRFKFNARN